MFSPGGFVAIVTSRHLFSDADLRLQGSSLRADGEPRSTRAHCGERLYTFGILAEEAAQPEINSSGEDADDGRDQEQFVVIEFRRLTGRNRNIRCKQSLERLMV